MMVRSTGSALFALVAVMVMPSQLRAQTVSDPDAGRERHHGTKGATDADDGSIVVTGRHITTTATKTDTPLIETPQSISVVTNEALTVRNPQRIKDALAFTAGVQIDKYAGDTRYDQIELRGFSATEFGEYRDGLRQVSANAIYYKNEPYGLESIEILKGPSSVLFGQNAPGGLFNLISKRPTRSTLAELQVDLGSFDYHQVKGDVSGSFNDEQSLYGRLTVLARDAGTFLSGKSKDDRLYVAPALTFEPTPSLKITAYAQYLKNEGTGWPFWYTDTDMHFYRVRTYDPNFDRLDQNQVLAGWSADWNIGDGFSFRQNARYGHVSVHSKITDANAADPGVTDLEREAYTTDGRMHSYSIDNQLSKKLRVGPAELNILFGYDYSVTYSHEDDRYAFGEDEGIPDFDLANPVYGLTFPSSLPQLSDQREKDTQGGVYGQVQGKMAGWIVTAGIRRDATSTRIIDLLGGADTYNRKENAVTWRTGLTKLFDNGLAPYVSYSTSFQIVPGTDFYGHPFVPSRGKQIEGGLKYQPRGIRGFVTASVYRLVQNNVLIDDPDHVTTGSSKQAGQIRSEGVELEASLQPVHGLDLGAAFTYQSLKYTDRQDPNYGKTPSGTPKVIASVNAQYKLPDGPLGGFSLGGGVRHTGKTWNDDGDVFRNHDAATYVDANIGYDLGHFHLALNVDNMLDKRTVTCNLGYCYQVVGRSLLGSIRYRY
jgi:iron complex outermembrane recepter protein